MVDKEVKPVEVIEKSDNKKRTSLAEIPTVAASRPPLQNPLFWVVIVGAIALALIIAAIIVGVVSHREMMRQNTATPGYSTWHWESSDGLTGNSGSYYRISSSTSGPTTSTTVASYTSTTGVVTNVSNDSLTIAGNGASAKVKTNSSTEYIDGKPKVNDSVTVVGTTDSKGTITATQVRIDND